MPLRHLLLVCLLGGCAPRPGIPTPAVKRSAEFWTPVSPAAAGYDSLTLAALDAEMAAGQYGLVDGWTVVRKGRIVWASEWRRNYDSVWAALAPADTVSHLFNYDHPDWHPWYHRSRLHTLQSVTKSITSGLIGLAIARGEIASLDAPILQYFDTTGLAFLDARKRAITVRHLLTMSAGIDWNESLPYTDSANTATQMEASRDWVAYVLNRPMSHEPGTHWAYSSGASALLAAVLVRATGRPVAEYAGEHLFAPLGIREWHWKQTPTGLHDTEGGLYLRTEDLARIAWLYHEDGVWEGRRVLPAGWVAQSFEPSAPTEPDARFRYGFQWWLYADTTTPGTWLPAGSGYGGQFPILLRADSAVIVVNQWNIHGRGLSPLEFVRRVRAARR